MQCQRPTYELRVSDLEFPIKPALSGWYCETDKKINVEPMSNIGEQTGTVRKCVLSVSILAHKGHVSLMSPLFAA